MVGGFSGPDIKSVSKGREVVLEGNRRIRGSIAYRSFAMHVSGLQHSFYECIKNNMVFDLDPWGGGKIMSEVMIAILLYVLKLRDKVKNEEKTAKQISWKNVHRGWLRAATVYLRKGGDSLRAH